VTFPWLRPARIAGLAFLALLAAVLLAIAARGLDWGQLRHILGSAKPTWIALTCALSTVALSLRALRWRILLNAEGQVAYPTVFWATAAGYFGNNFLPARAGELIRTFLIRSASGLEIGYVLATALSERVADAIVLVLIAATVLMMFPAQSGWLAAAAQPFAILGLVGALGVIALPLAGDLPQRVVATLPVPARIQPILASTVGSAIRGLAAFHGLSRFSGFLALTVIIWTIDAAGAMAAGVALGLPITLPISFLILSAVGLASAIPSTPGYVGVFQFVAVMVLSPFGFSPASAIAFIIVLQVVSYGVNAFWGCVGMIRYRRSRRLEAGE
jgi:uncharacterized membrane protein YbhN (UPF0104 family)